MSLLPSEVSRVRFELGYTNMVAGAYPYVSSVFASLDLILQQYLDAGASTTSSTTVAALPLGSAAAPVPLTLASPTGFSARGRVIIDVDARQEESFVESVSGSTITVFLRLAHAGIFPVTVEGGEAIVRDILRRLIRVSDPVDGRLERAAGSAGVAEADDVKFFASASGSSKSRLDETIRYQAYLRNELARSLGVVNLRTGHGSSGGGGSVEAY